MEWITFKEIGDVAWINIQTFAFRRSVGVVSSWSDHDDGRVNESVSQSVSQPCCHGDHSVSAWWRRRRGVPREQPARGGACWSVARAFQVSNPLAFALGFIHSVSKDFFLPCEEIAISVRLRFNLLSILMYL